MSGERGIHADCLDLLEATRTEAIKERAGLYAALEDAQTQRVRESHANTYLARTNRRLIAERDRLREALEWIANGEDWTAMGVRAVARAALRPAQDEQR
jgi:histidinol-phosphate/aromatic aminotransferase/cobyric acid decarboxylase-like protein